MSAAALLDYLIRPLEERLRDRQAKGLRGLEVDHRLVLGGLLDRQIAGLGAFEDLIHVGGRSPKQVRIARRIGHESPGLHYLAVWVHGRQPTLRRELHDSCSFSEQKAVR